MLDQGLKFQGFPVGVLWQFDDEEGDSDQIPVSPGVIVKLNPNTGEDYKVVETTGSALSILDKVTQKLILEFLENAFRQINPLVASAQKEAVESKKMDFAQLSAALKDKVSQH
jgi:hypothetical protein